jgi:hypothetical protein
MCGAELASVVQWDPVDWLCGAELASVVQWEAVDWLCGAELASVCVVRQDGGWRE